MRKPVCDTEEIIEGENGAPYGEVDLVTGYVFIVSMSLFTTGCCLGAGPRAPCDSEATSGGY